MLSKLRRCLIKFYSIIIKKFHTVLEAFIETFVYDGYNIHGYIFNALDICKASINFMTVNLAY